MQSFQIEFRQRLLRARQISNPARQHRPGPDQIPPRLMMKRNRELHQIPANSAAGLCR